MAAAATTLYNKERREFSVDYSQGRVAVDSLHSMKDQLYGEWSQQATRAARSGHVGGYSCCVRMPSGAEVLVVVTSYPKDEEFAVYVDKLLLLAMVCRIPTIPGVFTYVASGMPDSTQWNMRG